ncbi:MAG TPA: hypothetical protein VIL85_07890 [Thermomicrobiales bacterium]|jgi:hypothetical protein
MSEQDRLRKHLYDALDDVEATAKRLTGDESKEASEGQNTIVDTVNSLRHTVGSIPKPTAETEADEAAKEPEQA